MSRKDSAQFIEECYTLYEQKMYRAAFAILNDPDAAEQFKQVKIEAKLILRNT